MKRLESVKRTNWRQRLEEAGCYFHSLGGQYWNENAYYEFNSHEAGAIQEATQSLHHLCLIAVEHIISHGLFEQLGIDRQVAPTIIQSWESQEPSLYGRFDLRFDGASPPKMLEYNADTPTALLEGSLVQKQWLLDSLAATHTQCNSIHEALQGAWRKMRLSGEVVYFACVEGSEEDRDNIEYMRQSAAAAGVLSRHIAIEDLGWDSNKNCFIDLENRKIETIFKLYPWEWIVNEEFGIHFRAPNIKVLEPAWKMLLSNKAILPVLWELFPDHPNLLPAYYEAKPLGKHYVAKPFFSREGANISIYDGEHVIATAGNYGEEGYIFQDFAALPNFSGSHPVIGSWIIGGQAVGFGIRESDGLITHNLSRFVPHAIPLQS